jgi:uncharacterized protein
MLDPAGALVWPAQRLLVVADLHLEKGSAAADRGSLLPPWDTRVTLDRLAALLHRHRPATVVALGDSFHDARGSRRLLPHDRERLVAMAQQAAFIWVMGNHDPCPSEGLGGVWVSKWQLGPLLFRHQAHPAAADGEVSGHFHPKAQVATRAAYVTRPCFVHDTRRVILPALGAYTGGLEFRDPVIAGLFPGGGRVVLLGRDRLFGFAFGTARTIQGKPNMR